MVVVRDRDVMDCVKPWPQCLGELGKSSDLYKSAGAGKQHKRHGPQQTIAKEGALTCSHMHILRPALSLLTTALSTQALSIQALSVSVS